MTTAAPFMSRWRRIADSQLAICGLLALATLAVFWPVRNCPFISYDDHVYFTGNGWVQQGLTLPGLVWAFGTTEAANWHPLTWLSHMLDVSLFGGGPAGPHLMNLLLHGCNVLLVFLMLEEMTGARWRSAFVAADAVSATGTPGRGTGTLKSRFGRRGEKERSVTPSGAPSS